MKEFVVDPPRTPSVAVSGQSGQSGQFPVSGRFPVRRIFCVGRNYVAHIREMGNDEREPPFFFTKPADAVADSGGTVDYPPLSNNLHHEIELVVAIGSAGADIDPADALDHVWGYAVGIDLPRRDLQDEAKKAARPWDWAKGFDQSAPCGAVKRAADSGHPTNGRIWLAVNGVVRQDATLAEMIWSVPEIVAFCSRSVRLEPGDLIFTGTPAGVGQLVPGDRVTGGIDGVGEIDITIGDRR